MTALSDLRLRAQERADRVNATTITTAEWNAMVNASAAALYRLLTTSYEDYNVSSFDFTLAGGSPGNTLTVGPSGTPTDFHKLRKLARLSSSGQGIYTPVERCASLIEFDLLTAPVVSTYYGNVLVQYALYGATLEIRPAASAGATYRMLYVPVYAPLVDDDDTIDGQWLAQSGIDEWIVVDVARKAMIKEESLDTASLLYAEANDLKTAILKDLAPRDDNTPGRIVDAKRARAAFGPNGGWGGYGGFPW